MNQTERRLWLIKELLREKIQYQKIEIPQDAQGQRDLLRALMNVRQPFTISDEFLKVQDEYLRERNEERGITDASALPGLKGDGRLSIWQGDITLLKCGAIVNAANSGMIGCFQPLHGCIDNMIHTYSGIELRLECNNIMKAQGYQEPVGQAKITEAYNLPADHVIHTVGPMIQFKVRKEDEDSLASCYRSCLQVAADNGVESIAFCCISTGVFRFPQDLAAAIAVRTVRDFLNGDDRVKHVIFNVFKDDDLNIYRDILGEDE